MKTVFLIGNGFDINLGLDTSYKSFYKTYLNLPKSKEENDTIIKLKTHIRNDISGENKNWSDLEIGMGNYTEELSNFEELELVYDDLNEEMQEFIIKKESEFNNININSNLLKNNLCHLYEFGTEAEKLLLLSVLKAINEPHYIDIISFNYTLTLERIIGYKNTPLEIGISPYNTNNKTIVNSIIHIHGLSNDPIMGLNDEAQIKNEKLRNDIRIKNYLIKPYINSTLGHLLDKKTVDLIKYSKLICLFGLSFGETDRKWWELIGKRILEGINVILFIYDEKLNNPKARKLANLKLEWQNLFMQRAKIPENQQDNVRNRIIVILNSPIFNIKDSK